MRTALAIVALGLLVVSGLAFAAVALLATAAIVAAGQYLLNALAKGDRRGAETPRARPPVSP